jgi:hypothetical protein
MRGLLGGVMAERMGYRSLEELQAAPAIATVPIVSDPPTTLEAFALRDGRGFVICEPYWNTRERLTAGDVVVIERMRQGQFSPVIRRVHAVPRGVELRPEAGTSGATIKVVKGFREDAKMKIIGSVIWRLERP